MNYFDDVLSIDFNTQCVWLPANQFLFQLANLFLVLTYFANPNSMTGLLQLRFALTMAGLCFGLWGGAIICALDCMVWNFAFAIGNGLHLMYLVVKMRPIKFSNDHELLFEEIFKSVGIKRFQYKELERLAKLRSFKQGDYYAKQGITESNHIGIVSAGRLVVEISDAVISHIDKHEFIDSPEWIAMDADTPTTYQVSVRATCSCLVYVWRREDLMTLFKTDSVIKNVFDSLIGKDICKKLFSVHETFLTHDKYTKASSLLHRAPLLTYSAANLYEIHSRSNENLFSSPFTSPRGIVKDKLLPLRENMEKKRDDEHSDETAILLLEESENQRNSVNHLRQEDDFDLCNNDLLKKNLILRETNL